MENDDMWKVGGVEVWKLMDYSTNLLRRNFLTLPLANIKDWEALRFWKRIKIRLPKYNRASIYTCVDSSCLCTVKGWQSPPGLMWHRPCCSLQKTTSHRGHLYTAREGQTKHGEGNVLFILSITAHNIQLNTGSRHSGFLTPTTPGHSGRKSFPPGDFAFTCLHIINGLWVIGFIFYLPTLTMAVETTYIPCFMTTTKAEIVKEII